MEVIIDLPNAVEGKWRVDEKTNQLIITPNFYTSVTVQTIGRVTARGKSGAEEKRVLKVSALTGKPQLLDPAAAKPKLKPIASIAFDVMKPKENKDAPQPKTNTPAKDAAVPATSAS
jgi:hypothetical protein